MLITITGPSGSGKTTLANYLSTLNTNIIHINIDTIGHQVLKLPEVENQIKEKFNLQKESQINRQQLGDIVFNNRQKMHELSCLTWSKMVQIIDTYISLNQDKIILLDWILIPHTKYFKQSKLNILITSPFEERIKRIEIRDSIPLSKILEREQATIDFTKYSFDYIIYNENFKDTKRKVDKIYEKSIIPR